MSNHRYSRTHSSQLTLLVHPDCVFEQGREAFEAYRALIAPALRGQTVLVYWFYSDRFGGILHGWDSGESDRTRLYLEIRNYFLGVADVARFDDGKLFGEELLGWVANHQGGSIRIGGGYEELCVAKTARMIEDHLGDVLEESNVTTAVVPVLCFRWDTRC